MLCRDLSVSAVPLNFWPEKTGEILMSLETILPLRGKAESRNQPPPNTSRWSATTCLLQGGEMSMIRLGDRNASRGISSPRTGTARGRGAECREPILGARQLEGEIFSLDIPSHRTTGWADLFGSPNDFEKPPESPPVVNGPAHTGFACR